MFAFRLRRRGGWRVDELHRLDDFLDLSGWTLRVTDPLFGIAQRDNTPEREIERMALELLHQRRQRAASATARAVGRTCTAAA